MSHLPPHFASKPAAQESPVEDTASVSLALGDKQIPSARGFESMSFAALPNEANDRDIFAQAFINASIPETAAFEYASRLIEQALSPSSRFAFEHHHFVELGIRMGHREGFAFAMKKLRASTRSENRSLSAAVLADDESVSSVDETVNPKRLQEFMDEKDLSDDDEPLVLSQDERLRKVTRRFGDGAVWRDWSGMAPGTTKRIARSRFFEKMSQECTKFDCTDKRILMRVFADNKPLPFLVSDGAVFGLLLRLPSPGLLVGEDSLEITELASTVHELMNRLVVLLGPDHRGRLTMLTYRKDVDVPWIAALNKEWTDRLSMSPVDEVLVRLLRDAIETFRPLLLTLQRQLEFASALPDTYKPKYVVSALSRIHRQASVVSRSLGANAKVLTEFAEAANLVADVTVVSNVAESLRDLANEISENADEMMQLRLTMLEFVTQRNMKVFTYFSTISAPIGLITGWFGMNFTEMYELQVPGFYYGVIGFASGLVVLIVVFLVWINRDRHITPDDEKTAEIVLMQDAVDARE